MSDHVSCLVTSRATTEGLLNAQSQVSTTVLHRTLNNACNRDRTEHLEIDWLAVLLQADWFNCFDESWRAAPFIYSLNFFYLFTETRMTWTIIYKRIKILMGKWMMLILCNSIILMNNESTTGNNASKWWRRVLGK